MSSIFVRVASLFCAILLPSPGVQHAFGDDSLARTPHSAVAVFATGPWSAGDVRSACPVLKNRRHAKVAVFTRELTPAVVQLLKKVDALLEGKPELQWSFVFVSHENDPTPTEEDFEKMIEGIRTVAREAEIERLSIGLMQRVPKPGLRAKQRLGFVGEEETVVMLIAPPAQTSSYAVTAFKQVLKPEDLSADGVSSVVQALADSISELP